MTYLPSTPDDLTAQALDAALAIPNGAAVETSAVDMLGYDCVVFRVSVTATGGAALTDLVIIPQTSFDGVTWEDKPLEDAPSGSPLTIDTASLTYDYDVTGVATPFTRQVQVFNHGQRFARLSIEGTADSATADVTYMRRGRR